MIKIPIKYTLLVLVLGTLHFTIAILSIFIIVNGRFIEGIGIALANAIAVIAELRLIKTIKHYHEKENNNQRFKARRQKL